MKIIPKEITPQDMYKIMIGSVMPRPIAWVSSMDSAGRKNLAPFSFFTVASCNPPMVCFAPLFSNVDENHMGIAKDTLRNIAESGEFVVNLVSETFAKKMHQTSAPYPKFDNEFEEVGVAETPSEFVKPPRVRDSLINFECKLHQIVSLGDQLLSGSLIIGEIICVHLDDSVYNGSHIDPDVLQPIGRMAGTLYSTVKDRFELPRATV